MSAARKVDLYEVLENPVYVGVWRRQAFRTSDPPFALRSTAAALAIGDYADDESVWQFHPHPSASNCYTMNVSPEEVPHREVLHFVGTTTAAPALALSEAAAIEVVPFGQGNFRRQRHDYPVQLKMQNKNVYLCSDCISRKVEWLSAEDERFDSWNVAWELTPFNTSSFPTEVEDLVNKSLIVEEEVANDII